jgi:glycosyltransferase involved in cell wall biosynthesis
MKSKKIKILYTIPNFDTAGSGKVVYDLVKNIDKTKFEPHICCFHNNGDFFKEIERLQVPIHVFQFAAVYRPFLSLPFRVFKITRFFKREKFDLIHSWNWSSDFTEPLAAKIAKTPFVFTKKNMGWGNKSWRIKSFLSSKIILINSDMKTIFYRNNTDKTIDIPLGVDLEYFFPQSKEIKTSKEDNKNEFVIVSVVNLVPVKGVELLIKAVNQLNYSSIKLLIVGDDRSDYAYRLKEMITDRDKIKFIGKKNDVRPYLRAANLVVIPTLELGEGLPIAPIEAMASQRIVIGSNVPGVKDVLSNFPECLFKPNNVEDLKSKIIEIMKMHQKEIENLEILMRLYAQKHFSKEDFIKNHENLYKEMIV